MTPIPGNDWTVVKYGNGFGLNGLAGNALCNAERWEIIFPFQDGYALAFKNGTWYIINVSIEEVRITSYPQTKDWSQVSWAEEFTQGRIIR